MRVRKAGDRDRGAGGVPHLPWTEGGPEILGLRVEERRHVHLVAGRRLLFLLKIVLFVV